MNKVMKISEAHKLINNLDYEEGLKRKFSPQYSLIQVNYDGGIVAIYRYKERPSEDVYSRVLKDHPGTVQIPARVGLYPTENSLKEAINKRRSILNKMKSIQAERGTRKNG